MQSNFAKVILLLDFSTVIFFSSSSPSVQLFVMMEELNKSSGLRARMDLALVTGKIFIPLTQYVSEFLPQSTCGVLVVPVDLSILK